jgi:hypothetical protein
VDVFEDEDERHRLGKLLGPRSRRPCDLLLVVLGLHGLKDACCKPHQVCDRSVGTAVAQLLDRLVERIVVRYPRRHLDHVSQRGIGHTLAVGLRAPNEDGRRLQPVDELARQPALSDAGVAVDRDQVRPVVSEGPCVGIFEQLELGLTADERR